MKKIKKGTSKEETRMEELIKTEEFNKAKKDDTEEEKPVKEFKKNYKKEFKNKENRETKEVKFEKKEEVKEDLTGKTLSELKTIAKEKGNKGYSTMKKEELLNNLK